MRRLFLASLLLMLVAHSVHAQSPKREVRGAWIASVSNLDWPSRSSLTPQQQRDEFISLLNTAQSMRLNAVVVQVRPASDALYASEIEPWSRYLTGLQGRAPSPLYDPLVFMVDECHKRGIEFHAWLNPYRVTTGGTTTTSGLAANNVAKLHPEWVRTYNNALGLDPGEPGVRAHVTRVVMDIVKRYDVDAIHFDDYFYPYPDGTAYPDAATFQKYGAGLTLANWRRQNVNQLIYAIYDSIQVTKPWVKFGISPFGIWQNITGARGLQSYADIYADSRGWLQAGKLDYLAPQNYWPMGGVAWNPNNNPQHEKLAAWWAQNAFGRQMLMGNATYQVASTGLDWPASEITTEVRVARSLGISGNIHFRMGSLVSNPKSVRDSLIRSVYQAPALVPTMPWKDAVAPNPPTGFTVKAGLLNVLDTLRWTPPAPASDGDTARYYAVYRSLAPTVDVTDMRNLLALIPAPARQTIQISVTGRPEGANWTYVVTALDRGWNESVSTAPAGPTAVADAPTAPPTDFALEPNAPNPFNPTTTIPFTLTTGGRVTLEVFSTLGQKVATLVDSTLGAGRHEATFDATDLPSGTYFYRLTLTHPGAPPLTDTRPMLLVK